MGGPDENRNGSPENKGRHKWKRSVGKQTPGDREIWRSGRWVISRGTHIDISFRWFQNITRSCCFWWEMYLFIVVHLLIETFSYRRIDTRVLPGIIFSVPWKPDGKFPQKCSYFSAHATSVSRGNHQLTASLHPFKMTAALGMCARQKAVIEFLISVRV